MTENNKKKETTKHFFNIRTKSKRKTDNYNGIIYYNSNPHIIFKFCTFHNAINS